jgi:hypothetical protein
MATKEPAPVAILAARLPRAGRHCLLARPGKAPFREPLPCYLMTEQECHEAIVYWRVTYGVAMEMRAMPVTPTCVHDHPYNGSQCEQPHGHEGQCSYFESPRGELARWTPGETEARAV